MKKILPAFFLLISIHSPAWSMQFVTHEDVFLDPETEAEEDLYLAGQRVTFLGTAQQDLCAAASSRASISGKVFQDLNLAAVDAEINAQIGDDLRVVASELVIASSVGGSALIYGSNVFIKAQSTFEHDVWIMGEEIHMAGMVNGNLRVTASKLFLDGTVVNNVKLEAKSIVLGKNARLLSRLDYISGEEMQVNPGAILQTKPQWKTHKPDGQIPGESKWKKFLSVGKLLVRITLYLGFLALGSLFILLLPAPSRRLAQVMRYRFWPSLGWGALTLLGLLIIMLVLLVSVLGIPLAVILGILAVVAASAAFISAGYMLGILIIKPQNNAKGKSLGAFGLGFTLLALLTLIPILGPVISILILFTGFGALWLAKGFMEPVPAPAS
ncbi:hypothetical protein JW933_04280, partial [candidate division FCPU426 bacterium]|nr:hypothetical protein [candidate division FCPU426 bacterium]